MRGEEKEEREKVNVTLGKLKVSIGCEFTPPARSSIFLGDLAIHMGRGKDEYCYRARVDMIFAIKTQATK